MSYSDDELDSTRAYVVLAHAEIEAFFEDLALAKANAAKTVFDQTGSVRPSLRRIVSYYVAKKEKSWQHVLAPPADIVDKAVESYKAAIQANHGIKPKNLEKLLFPIGILESHLDATWLAEMNSFGINRGGFAHSSIGAQRPPDPLSQLQAVNHLLQGLLDMDRRLSRLR